MVSAPLPDRDRLRGFAGEIVLACLAVAVTSLGVQLLVSAIQVPVNSLVPAAVGTLGAAALIGLVLLIAMHELRGRRARAATPVLWCTLSALATLPLALLLLGTKHYLFGISGDQSFRVQYLSRYAESARLADIAYPDLPPYYPAGWFWIGGRVADAVGVPGWEAYKPFAIATMAVAGVVAFCVWSLLVGRGTAALLALITTVVGLRMAAYSPYSWLLAAALPALAVLGWRLVGQAAAGAPRSRWVGSAVLMGVALGAAGAVYGLHFWFLGVLLVVLAVTAVLRTPAGQRVRATRRVAVPAVVVGAVALPLVLLVWAPYLAGLLAHGWRSGAAQRFLPGSGAMWPLPMVELSALGVLTLVGTVWIVARIRTSDVAQALGLLVLTCYAWFALSTLALAVGTTLLAFRLEPVLVTALACGGVLGVLDGARAAVRWLQTSQLAGPRPVSFAAVVATLSFAGLLGMLQTVPEQYEWSKAAQYGDYYPTGQTPVGTVHEGDPGAWNDELIATIDQLTDAPPSELVVLSTHSDLFAYRPYFTFQTTIEQYANPLADFTERRAAIERWAASSTPAELLTALDATPSRPPEVFVLSRQPNGLHLGVTYDTFPAQPNIADGTVVFDPDLFEDPAFERRDVGPLTVIVRDTTGPAADLSGTN